MAAPVVLSIFTQIVEKQITQTTMNTLILSLALTVAVIITGCSALSPVQVKVEQ